MQNSNITIYEALEIPQSCTKPLMKPYDECEELQKSHAYLEFCEVSDDGVYFENEVTKQIVIYGFIRC